MWTGPLDLAWSNSFDVADWIRDRLHPFARDIGSVIPDSFDAYVVLVHPHRAEELRHDALARLAEVLASNTTTPDRVWYCIWEGYGDLHGGRAVSGRPPGLVPPQIRAGGRVRLPQRNYYLYTGDRAGWSSLAPWHSPNIWWPEDRAWCVAREIDFVATYVGGSSDLIADLISETTLAADRVVPTDPFEEGREFDRHRA